jgi:hypothetical protein
MYFHCELFLALANTKVCLSVKASIMGDHLTGK